MQGAVEGPRADRILKKKELNRDREEFRSTQVYLAHDAVDAQFPGGVLVVRTFREVWKLKSGKRAGKSSKEVVYHVSSLAPERLGGGDVCAAKLAGIVRTHWYVEVYHGKRDNGYHEDTLARRCDTNIMAAMMVARTLGMWVCARSPGKTTAEVRLDLLKHPSKLLRIMMKGGLQ